MCWRQGQRNERRRECGVCWWVNEWCLGLIECVEQQRGQGGVAAARERWRAPALALQILLLCFGTLSRMLTMQQTSNKGTCKAPNSWVKRKEKERKRWVGENPSLSPLLPYFGLCAHVNDQGSERRKRKGGGVPATRNCWLCWRSLSIKFNYQINKEKDPNEIKI